MSEDAIQRLQDELREVSTRLEKLRNFLGGKASENIDEWQLTLLKIQEKAMTLYVQVLLERIKII